ncbi:hypothetical protein F5Y04DRAFT_283568 [Hypomontagnella monticulosa]|nr:hypothetical protein F5Y04DRAFT_283568 [Hypomontagnella monticulosa]
MGPKDAATPGVGLREWYDHIELENSTELYSLNLNISRITIEFPDNSSDADLKALIKCANNPPKDSQQQKESLQALGLYIEKLKLEEYEKRDEAENEARIQIERRRERHEKRGRISNKLHSIIRGLVPPIKNVLDFVIKILRGGMQALETTLFLASEITFQTHYEVAVRAIMLFITTYESAGDLTKRVVLMFESIEQYGCEMGALQNTIQSVSMSKALSKLFVSMVEFIAAAGSYMKHGTITKMILHLGGGDDKFEGLIKAIRDDYAEVVRVMTFAQVIISRVTHDRVNEVGEDTARISHQLSLLNDSFTPDISRQLRVVYEHSMFQAKLHVEHLRAMLFDTPYEITEEMTFNQSERVFLSPQDRWQRHLRGVGALATPQTAVKRPLFWIAGHITRRNVSWVSSMCVDLVSHFQEFNNFDTAYVFCKRGRGERYSPTLLIKTLAVQLLESHPFIATKNLSRLSSGRFRKIGTNVNGHLAWQLLLDILGLIEAAPEFQSRTVFMLIDRLDLCISEEGFSVLEHLVPRLQNLSRQVSRVQVLITTARISPFGVPTLRRGSEWLRAYGKRIHG